MKIQIRTDERVIFVGTTGSGKTELARYFLTGANRVLVIDPKHKMRLEGYKSSKRLPLLSDNFRMIYRPEDDDDLHLARLVSKLKRAGNCTIYVDELSTLAENFSETTRQLADVARTGRESHVSLWSALQRPRWVPRIFFTESEQIFLFSLRSGDDRRYMAEFVGPEVIDPIEMHDFWYGTASVLRPSKMRLDLKKRTIMQV